MSVTIPGTSGKPTKERSFLVYMPPELCPQFTNGTLQAPLLMAIHCFGCTAGHEFQKFKNVAETFGMILVVPIGTQSSWNANGVCCGAAKAQAIDDVGFLDTLVHEVTLRWRLPHTHVYATGNSNGGFMVSALALRKPTRPQWLKAIAPLSGNMFEGYQNVTTPLAVFMHHSIADERVMYKGCCGDCCCDIRAPICVSIDQIFAYWRTINHCKEPSSASSLQVNLATPDLKCISGVGCATNTTLCQWTGDQHTSWAKSFPLAGEIGTFFARHACTVLGHGKWKYAENQCTCAEGYEGAYCWDYSSKKQKNRNTLVLEPMPPSPPTTPSPTLYSNVVTLGVPAAFLLVGVWAVLGGFRSSRRNEQPATS
eukprot:TRINITY_DN61253_c0_g1_i2.p1 TRINITY_DN61253_c0_g1~~TRINITY_DN61253_c0_g1_i2.p1  ORF type:complete len:394 (+),score=17.66 TRINITY_DN61253_c0_g1_i2:80-1183(+)